jgi:inward rectifier potassium channel
MAKKAQPRYSTWRLLNKDGTFNVERTGLRQRKSEDIYHRLLRMGWRKFLLFIFGNYLTVNLAFATAYFLCGPGALTGTEGVSGWKRLEDCFFFSVQTFATIGYGKMTPTGTLPNLLVTLEALVGLLGVALATGIIFARFSRPTARVVFSDKAVIHKVDGVKSLVFRMANLRLNQIMDAHVSVIMSVDEKTAEGVRYRNFYDLHLERDNSPMFALSWTIVYPIIETSPLAHKNKEMLAASHAEIIVTMTGTDDTFNQQISARYSYIPDEIEWDREFRDILTRDDQHRKVIMDVSRIHDLEARPEPQA